MIKEIVHLRLGHTGDASRPLGWKKIAIKVKSNLGAIKEIRRSKEYYDYISKICLQIGVSRLQAKACRKNKGLANWIETSFGLDTYSARILADEIDTNPLPKAADRNKHISEERIEELVQETEKLIIEPTDTESLSRKHIKWLISQGYADTDKLLLRASTMTRSSCSRTVPEFIKQKSAKQSDK